MDNKKGYKPEWMLLDDLFEERAAILEYDAGFNRYNAEQNAAQAMGFANKAELKMKVQALKAGEYNDTDV